jgi:hypothetical protein
LRSFHLKAPSLDRCVARWQRPRQGRGHHRSLPPHSLQRHYGAVVRYGSFIRFLLSTPLGPSASSHKFRDCDPLQIVRLAASTFDLDKEADLQPRICARLIASLVDASCLQSCAFDVTLMLYWRRACPSNALHLMCLPTYSAQTHSCSYRCAGPDRYKMAFVACPIRPSYWLLQMTLQLYAAMIQ